MDPWFASLRGDAGQAFARPETAIASYLLASLAMRLVIAPQDGVDARLVTFALRLEPAEHVVIQLDPDSHLLRMNNFGARPLLVGHRTAVAVLRGNGLGLDRSLPVETLPIGLALQRHQAAIRLLLVGPALYQHGT